MATLKDTVADALQSLSVPVEPNDVVRLMELDAVHSGLDVRLEALEAIPAAHDPVTVDDGETINLGLTDQELTAEVILPADTVIQNAATGEEMTFDDPVAADDELDLGSIYVSEVVIVRREVGGADLATGEDGVDYFLDAEAGIITIPAGSNLITDTGEEVFVTFDCALVKDGSGLVAHATGLMAAFGTAHHQIARGDHEHANDHQALTTEDSASVELIIDRYQKLIANVLLAVDSGLKIDGGLAADFAVVAAKSVTDDHEDRIAALEGAGAAEEESTTVADTDSIDLTMDSNGQISGVVVVGSGLVVTSGVGVEVNWDEVAAADHIHDNATDEVAGFMPPEAVVQLADHEERITALEASDVVQSGVLNDHSALLDDHEDRIEDLETNDAAQDVTLGTHTSQIAGHETRIDALEASESVVDGRIDVLEAAKVRHDRMALNLVISGGFDAAAKRILVTDEAVFISGDFTKAGTFDHRKISKIARNGVPDARFDPDTSFSVTPVFLAVDNDGNLFAGASSKCTFKGANNGWIHKVDGAGDAVAGWTPPSTIAQTGSDELKGIEVVNGNVFALSWQTLRVLNRTSGASVAYKNADANLHAIEALGDYIYLAGRPSADFDGVDNPAAIKKLFAPATTSDARFLKIEESWSENGGTGGAASVNEIVIAPDGNFILAGNNAVEYAGTSFLWNGTGGSTHGGMYRLFSHGLLDLGWTINIATAATTDWVRPLCVDKQGRVYFTGAITSVNSTATSAQNRLYRVDADGDGFVEIGKFNGVVNDAKCVDDEHIVVVGEFTTYGNDEVAVGYVVFIDSAGRLLTDLEHDAGLTSDQRERIDSRDFDAEVRDILIDGSDWWFAGAFTRFGQYTAPRIAKLDRGMWDIDFKSEVGFQHPQDFLMPAPLSSVGVIAAGEDGTFGSQSTERPLWKVNPDGSLDTGFTAPTTLGTSGSDRVSGIAVFGQKVAVTTELQLVILNADGSVDERVTGTNRLNSVLSAPLSGVPGLLVTSHAYAEEDVPQRLAGVGSPKGAKRLNSSLDVESTWALDMRAGTGAQSSCGRSILGHDDTYFVIGNARLNFDSPSTAWNAELIGNLLLYSEQFQQADWDTVGSLTVTANDTTDPDGGATADKLADTNAVDHAYIYQDVTVPDDTNRYVFSVYVKKDSDETRFPMFRFQFIGGTEVDFQVQFNTETGATDITGNLGGGAGVVEVDDEDTYWRIKLSLSNTDTGNTTARVTIYPAYSDTLGGSSESLTGFIHAWGAQLRWEDWNDAYQVTTTTQFLPDNEGSNSTRFRGLYKIGVNGEEDPDFDCRIELSEVGHVIPFGTDSSGRIYIGGPVQTIYDAQGDPVSVEPWRLYRLTSDGKYDASFEDFDDRVLVARVADSDTIVVGGRFTRYKHKNVGYWVILNAGGGVEDPCCGGGGGGGGVSESTHAVTSGVGPVIITAESESHAARVDIASGEYDAVIVLEDGWENGQVVRVAMHTPTAPDIGVSFRTGSAGGAEVLGLDTDGDGQTISLVFVWRDDEWELDGMTRLDGERKVNRRGDTMEGALHFPLRTASQAALVPVDLEGPKFTDVTATENFVIFTANRADGPMKRVFVRITADNPAGVVPSFANGIIILGEDVATIADGECVLIELQSYGLLESQTIAVVHGQVSIGAGGPGGGDDGPSDDPPPVSGVAAWMINVDFTDGGIPYSGVGVLGEPGDWWNQADCGRFDEFALSDTNADVTSVGMSLRMILEGDVPSAGQFPYTATVNWGDAGAPVQGFGWHPRAFDVWPYGEVLTQQDSSHLHEVMRVGLRNDMFFFQHFDPYPSLQSKGSILLSGFRINLSNLAAGNYMLIAMIGADMTSHYVYGGSGGSGSFWAYWNFFGYVGGDDISPSHQLRYGAYNPTIETDQLVERVQYEFKEFTVNSTSDVWIDVFMGTIYGFQLIKLS